MSLKNLNVNFCFFAGSAGTTKNPALLGPGRVVKLAGLLLHFEQGGGHATLVSRMTFSACWGRMLNQALPSASVASAR